MSTRTYVVAVILTIAALLTLVRELRHRRLRAKYVLTWLVASALFAPLAVIPGLLDASASALGISYGPALLIVLGLGFFAFALLQFSADLSRLTERSRVLAEEIALLNERLSREQPDTERRLLQ